MLALEQRPILVLGGDGYIGWPLSLRLARQWPRRRVVIVDNLLRRRLVAQMGASSLLPITSSDERLATARLLGIDNLEYVLLDAASPSLAAFIDHERPGLVYHLAQQCSAPFSMRDGDSAILTLVNNETSNLRLLWAVRDSIPDAHVVKMGSFGEYAKYGIDIPEGYFQPIFRGRTPERPMPYPREADDFYHVTKINDTNFISVACRKWRLRVTDVMQSTVFGAQTVETSRHASLHTRFDYDECFGTVLNRFVVQALIGEPLTVYGTGHQRTGLIALEDSITRLTAIAAEPPEAGVHRVINNVTETSYSINEIAEEIRGALAARGCEVRIERAAHDPRCERPEQKMRYDVDRSPGDTGPHKALRDVVLETFEVVERWRDQVRPETLVPVTRWAPSPHAAPRGESAASAEARPDAWWESLREREFSYADVNFNPGSLARPARSVQKACAAELDSDLAASPLIQYSHARATEERVRTLAHELWPLPNLDVTINYGATQVINLIALALSRLSSPSQPIVVLSTRHEHPGGIGAFQRHPAFRVKYLSDEALHDPQRIAGEIDACRPALLAMSHVFYDTGRALPVAQIAECVQSVSPQTLVLVDATQSAGLYPLPSGSYDAVVASTHKWLFGPLGGGLLWTAERFRRTCGALEWSGTGLLANEELRPFALAGGHFFPLYRGIEECLRLYRSIGPQSILARSRALRAVFDGAILDAFRWRQIPVERLSPPDAAVLAAGFAAHDPYRLYRRLTNEGIHVKCIKGVQVDGRQWNILRFGFPYFESHERLERALSAIRRLSADECTPLDDQIESGSYGHDIARI